MVGENERREKWKIKKKPTKTEEEEAAHEKKPLRLLIVFFSQMYMYCRQTCVWIMSNHNMRLKI
jgi:hypothetical protein